MEHEKRESKVEDRDDKYQQNDSAPGTITQNAENENTCNGCGKELAKKLSCPICLKKKIHSYFCTQECFKISWKEHVEKVHEKWKKEEEEEKKKLMQIVKKKLSPEHFDPTNRKYWIYDRHLKNFLNFVFTGNLRPWPITKMNAVPLHIKRPDYAITSIPESELKYKRKSDIYVNSQEEIENIREACLLGRRTLDYAHSLVAPGVTTDEIDKKVHNFIIEHNAYPSTLNYYEFPKSCCTSVNEIVCHGIPDLRPLQNGDIINIDISVFFKGVHADLNETFFVGDLDQVPKEAKELVQTCYFSLMESIKKCKPGMLYKNIGNIIDSYVSKKGFSVVRTYSGHGVGKLFHSNPTVPHFKKNKAVGIMKAGHVFTIEPMINQGHYSDVLWPDKWTSATSDGKLSAQFEHTLLITDKGVEILTKRLADSPSLGFDTRDDLYEV
ncbi:methionine aminopeptidase 1b, putative [Plasmodium knowlesi strain H]|uniref:Methionine aminopeptidase n=3 Tax=Plasmodium knowlesi TaxID=5850 RepID=A0A5K1UJM1_PLAKH|nr:methionine aminopeptidase 1b, putative [Plasmodium knowlesi strain H]OTN65929.1 Methionine aminopeptidase [Plasmodium knowlesi]CAA9987797.1 methionine aminopeptidase 1b, putative [Plasmodium knowlesi strain H]SBO22422.1 methionine aminopeptidase 1b, putative [Plasmodium knowlesi strain H]SBO29532.1 methionine aminopeptidase 1b, putative [Plasmodium knowlesi strain H]VVS77271.1 methionine aminopeptidase 1b, putative [Plasmodium knowlesi strain H]|eukprot:XP_002258794.1 methionine aminopeptidase, putative [Plasmodium knowlesi strain H]